MQSSSRNASFSDIFLPSKSVSKKSNANLAVKPVDIVEIPNAVASRCSHSSEANSSSSLSAESDSGIASYVEDNTCRKQRKSRRPPGSLNVDELFARAADNSCISDDYNLRMVKEIRIEDGSIGYGYERLFCDGLNEKLRVVCVEDPYIATDSQVCNFVVFCEILVARAPSLKKIVLRTRVARPDVRSYMFADLKNALLARNIELEIQRSDTIHDREIRFDNGWTYRIGRGLDYFQKQQGVTLGLTNYNFRRCLETSVCIVKELR